MCTTEVGSKSMNCYGECIIALRWDEWVTSSRLVRYDFEGVSLAKMLRRERSRNSLGDLKKRKPSDHVNESSGPEDDCQPPTLLAPSGQKLRLKKANLKMRPLVKKYLSQESDWIQRRQLLHSLPSPKPISLVLEESAAYVQKKLILKG